MGSNLALQFLANDKDSLTTGSALSAIENVNMNLTPAEMGVTRSKLEQHITIYDLKRLESYAKNLVDFHLIMDLVPTIARLHFAVLPPGTITLSYI